MLSSTLLNLLSLGAVASAHFHVLYPEWRGDSLELETASQWIWPCANISETTNGTRTKWPTTGGSISINGSHPSAFTYVNLGLGQNVTNFNISLVDNFNQTGAGVLCLKDAVRAALEEVSMLFDSLYRGCEGVGMEMLTQPRVSRQETSLAAPTPSTA